ncbi:UNVERIFIED_ORG: addiction module HigA family antidote [Pseudomonas lini]
MSETSKTDWERLAKLDDSDIDTSDIPPLGEDFFCRAVLMNMHNPPHPGEFIAETYLDPNGISGLELAEKLGITPSTLSRVLKVSSRVTPEMALLLSVALGRSPESWLAMQDAYDLWVAQGKGI